SMQREELLNLLDQPALDAFEGAKRLALAHGGVLSPLHVIAAVMNAIQEDKQADHEPSSLIVATHKALAARYPKASESIKVSKETQTTILEASRLARL